MRAQLKQDSSNGRQKLQISELEILIKEGFLCFSFCTLQSTLALRTLAITDKIQIPGERVLTGNDSRYYGLSR